MEIPVKYARVNGRLVPEGIPVAILVARRVLYAVPAQAMPYKRVTAQTVPQTTNDSREAN